MIPTIAAIMIPIAPLPRSLTRPRPASIDVDGGQVYACRACRVEYHDPLAGMWDMPDPLCRCGARVDLVSYDARWRRRRARAKSVRRSA